METLVQPPASPAPTTGSKRKILLVALLALVVLGVGGYYFFQSPTNVYKGTVGLEILNNNNQLDPGTQQNKEACINGGNEWTGTECKAVNNLSKTECFSQNLYWNYDLSICMRQAPAATPDIQNAGINNDNNADPLTHVAQQETGAQRAERECVARGWNWREGGCVDPSVEAAIVADQEAAALVQARKDCMARMGTWENNACTGALLSAEERAAAEAAQGGAAANGGAAAPAAGAIDPAKIRINQNGGLGQLSVGQRLPDGAVIQPGVAVESSAQQGDPAQLALINDLDAAKKLCLAQKGYWDGSKCYSVAEMTLAKCFNFPNTTYDVEKHACVSNAPANNQEPAPVNGNNNVAAGNNGGSPQNNYYYDGIDMNEYQRLKDEIALREREAVNGDIQKRDEEIAALEKQLAAMRGAAPLEAPSNGSGALADALAKAEAAKKAEAQAAAIAARNGGANAGAQVAVNNASAASAIHGAAIRGSTGPEALLYPLVIGAVNAAYFVRRRRSAKK